jgi:hypothetical protein
MGVECPSCEMQRLTRGSIRPLQAAKPSGWQELGRRQAANENPIKSRKTSAILEDGAARRIR